jgi:hypothetical protein
VNSLKRLKFITAVESVGNFVAVFWVLGTTRVKDVCSWVKLGGKTGKEWPAADLESTD